MCSQTSRRLATPVNNLALGAAPPLEFAARRRPCAWQYHVAFTGAAARDCEATAAVRSSASRRFARRRRSRCQSNGDRAPCGITAPSATWAKREAARRLVRSDRIDRSDAQLRAGHKAGAGMEKWRSLFMTYHGRCWIFEVNKRRTTNERELTCGCGTSFASMRTNDHGCVTNGRRPHSHLGDATRAPDYQPRSHDA